MKTVFKKSGDGEANTTAGAQTGREVGTVERPSMTRRRTTRSRRAIAEAIARLERSFSARELHAAMRKHERPVGLTTVYRTLALLLEEGRVREAGQRDGEALYAACAVDGHHHHLVCERCGTVEESTVCRCDELERELTREYGFVLSSAPETYYGLCAECAGEAGR